MNHARNCQTNNTKVDMNVIFKSLFISINLSAPYESHPLSWTRGRYERIDLTKITLPLHHAEWYIYSTEHNECTTLLSQTLG